MNPLTYPDLPETCLVVLIGASGAGKSTLAATWPASQVLNLDAMREAVSDDFSVKLSVLNFGHALRVQRPAPAAAVSVL
ncbi:Chromosomal replication initiator protein DnaA [Actinacidiphila cocklensis]|jgi:predicted kinase|uniref:Chromosomal replication initiator protein DnaA n=1 Tax=Actinacidiphila cocklensis TaxID=887465 RepID=A0A9W4GQP1_9ACTN|nr:Chromosomal replication initiator protein DnaA [Actinacidiphila cocklensis]